ncbi:MAG: DUF5615 family PIN-like protein [Caldilineaceae bacterium]
MKIQYLFDENLDPRFVKVLARHYPMINAIRIGGENAPPLGIKDPDLLRYLEKAQRTLITDNRKSMPGHVVDHLQAGGHHWGIFMISKEASYKRVVDALAVYWDVSEAEEWFDQIEWVVL